MPPSASHASVDRRHGPNVNAATLLISARAAVRCGACMAGSVLRRDEESMLSCSIAYSPATEQIPTDVAAMERFVTSVTSGRRAQSLFAGAKFHT